MRSSASLAALGLIGGKIAKLVATATIVVGTIAGSVAFAPAAFASPSGDLAAATNAARAAAGLSGLQTDPQLNSVAQAWANHLAAANTLSHNAALRSQVKNWSNLGENVGMAIDVASVQQAFMNSPEHRANILNAKYTLMGVGAAVSTLPSCQCQVLWVVVDFKRPATSATTPAPPVKAAPKPATPPSPTQPTRRAQQVVPTQPAHQPVKPPTSGPALTATPSGATQPVPTTPVAQPTTPQAPIPSESATALGSQLVAAASSPASAAASDPVSQLLTFATIMSGLPG